MNKTFTFLLLILSFSLSAQSIKVRGTIKDSIGSPLEFANVIASIQSSGDTESYGITNHEGRFQLDLPKGDTYLLRASFLGFKTEVKTVVVPSDAENMYVDFVLFPEESQLEGVELVYEMPVTIKGDTIIYNADSFSTGEERKLGDLMKKMPGIEINADGEIQVEVKTVVVPSDAENMYVDFVLFPEESQLEGVELVYEMPVTIKGDTIIYNADSFSTGEERKLGDLMKKMPGIEINADGEIQVEGKTVQKVMVEGKDFFDGDSKLATKNIPANAVDKVEVLRNYNQVDQMRGLGNDMDNTAINIKLKEGKKNFWFGEVTAGAGIADTYGDDKGRYLAHPKLFYYSPKYSINLLTDFNNIGEVPFTFRDYFRFTGGFRNFNRGGGTSFSIRDSDLGFAMAQNDRAKAIDAKFIAGNFSYVVNEKLDLSGFAILD